MPNEENLEWLKKEFVSEWKSTPAHARGLAPATSIDAEQIRRMRSQTQQLSCNGVRK
ncbi:MAG: hypothetical protein JO235_15560 [Chroococcidiopsidaceae cyanobacterium CP_BM_RX_35]|nr:hypothetical protein [Chroococcidiopsidaceae cyanobacterium CP_BM_RX_35]